MIQGNNGCLTAELGDKVSFSAVEKFKVKLGEKAMISVLPGKINIVKTHYVESKKQNIYCTAEDGTEGECCKAFGKPRIRYGIAVLQYETDSRGKPVLALNPDDEPRELYQIKSLLLGFQAYNALLEIRDIVGDLSGIDLRVNCVGEEKYQNYQFFQLSERQYPKIQGIEKTLRDRVLFYREHFDSSIARHISPEELKAWISSGVANAASRALPYEEEGETLSEKPQIAYEGNRERLSSEAEASLVSEIDELFV
jgi:hypothetical protein